MWNLKTWQVCSSDVHVKRSTFWMLRNLMFYMFGCTYLGICRSFGGSDFGVWGRVFLIIFFVGSQIPRWFRWFPNLDHTRGPWNHGNKIHHTSTWHQRMVEGEPWGGCDIGTPTPIPFGTPTQPEGPGMQVCRRPGAIVQFIYLYEMRRQAPACLYKFTILH